MNEMLEHEGKSAMLRSAAAELAEVVSLRMSRFFAREARATLLTLWGAAGAVLLVACIPRLGEAGLGLRVIGYTVLVSMLVALLLSCVSALATARLGPKGSIRGSFGTGMPGASPPQRLGRALVVAQISLALVLLAAGGLLMHSVVNSWGVDLGFDPSRVLEVRTELQGSRYWEEVLQELVTRANPHG